MPFRYQKRINLGKGVGINVTQSGVSSSYRTKYGSVGSRGFSFRTGIPGLSFRSGWGKSGPAGLLVIVLVFGAVILVYNLVRLLIYGLSSLINFIRIHFNKISSKDPSL